jgi:hypothetical protein
MAYGDYIGTENQVKDQEHAPQNRTRHGCEAASAAVGCRAWSMSFGRTATSCEILLAALK